MSWNIYVGEKWWKTLPLSSVRQVWGQVGMDDFGWNLGPPAKPTPRLTRNGTGTRWNPARTRKHLAISCYIWRFATAVHAHQIEVVTSSAVGSEVLTHKDHGRAPPGRRNPGLCQERCQAAWKGVVVSEAALHLGHGYKGKPHYI